MSALPVADLRDFFDSAKEPAEGTAMHPGSVRDWAGRLGVASRSVSRWRSGDVTIGLGESISDRAGVHPTEIWGDRYLTEARSRTLVPTESMCCLECGGQLELLDTVTESPSCLLHLLVCADCGTHSTLTLLLELSQ